MTHASLAMMHGPIKFTVQDSEGDNNDGEKDDHDHHGDGDDNDNDDIERCTA